MKIVECRLCFGLVHVPPAHVGAYTCSGCRGALTLARRFNARDVGATREAPDTAPLREYLMSGAPLRFKPTGEPHV